MRRYKVMGIYSLRAADAKESAKRILTQEGMLDIEIGCATPDQLDGDKGYHVNVSVARRERKIN